MGDDNMKTFGKIIGTVIAIIKTIAAADKNKFPDIQTRTRVKLDRVRHFRLTPYSFQRAEEIFGKPAQRFNDWLGRLPNTAETLVIRAWLLLVDEDRDLTPEKMSQILNEYLAGGWKGFRERRFMQALNQWTRKYQSINDKKENQIV